MKSTLIMKFSCSHLAIARCRDIRQIATYASIVVIFPHCFAQMPCNAEFLRWFIGFLWHRIFLV